MNKSCEKYSFHCHIRIFYRLIIIIIAVLIISNFIYEKTSIYYRKLYFPLFSLHLNVHDLYMAKGEEFKLRLIGLNKRVQSYYSTDFRVAGVNFNGRIFAYRTGYAFIIVKVDGKELKCRVNVLDINKNKLMLKVGDKYRLEVHGDAGRISFKSSNAEAVSVNRKGTVTAKKEGRSVITVKTRGLTFRCTVIIKGTKE